MKIIKVVISKHSLNAGNRESMQSSNLKNEGIVGVTGKIKVSVKKKKKKKEITSTKTDISSTNIRPKIPEAFPFRTAEKALTLFQETNYPSCLTMKTKGR